MPVSDPRVASLSFVELNWYACMIEQDLIEASNRTVEYIEYLASFSNPAGVEQVRKERDSKKTRPETDTAAFADILARQFGRELAKEELIDG